MASEIRANTLKNRVGLGTVSFTNTGPVVSGIVTANELDVTDDLTIGGEFNMQGTFDNNKYIDARIGSSNSLVFRSSSGGAGNLVTMLQLGVSGTSLVGNFALGDSSDSSSAAGPEFTLNRNSSSPANADYLGQIKFAGRSSTGVQKNYAKITGKILDVTNGAEDGILEFAHIRNGSQTITGRWRSDSLQLLNDTNLSVAGDTTLTGDIDVDGHTNLDNVSIAGVTTITGSGNALEIVGGLVRSRNTAAARFVANNGSAEGYFGWSSGVLTVGQAAATLSLEATGSNHIQLKTNGGERLRINSSGKVIVGNNGTTFGNAAVQAFIQHGNTAGESGFSSVDTTSVAAGVGGEIAFHGKYNTGAQDYAYLGHVRGIKENATAGNTACALTFHTRPNATAPQERLRITSDGKVGINGNSPAADLSVKPTAAHCSAQVVSGDGSTIVNLTSVQGSEGRIGMNSNHPLAIYAGGLEKVRITSGGRLLIATTTEGHSNADDLTIATAAGSLGNTGITIRSSTTGDGNIFFSDATSGDGETKGVIKYAHNTDHMQFNTAGSERLRIESVNSSRARFNFGAGNSDFTNPDIGGSTSGVSINKNTLGQIYASTDNADNTAANDYQTVCLNVSRRNTSGDGPQIALDRGGWIKASIAGLQGSNTATSGPGIFAVYTHDYSSGQNVRTERIRVSGSNGNVGISDDQPSSIPRKLWVYEASNDPYIRIQRGATNNVTMGGFEIASSNGNGNNVLATMLARGAGNSATTGSMIFQVRDQGNNYEVVRLMGQSQGAVQGNRMLVNGNQVCVFGSPLGTSGTQARDGNITTYNTVYEHSSSSYRTSDNGAFGGVFAVGGNANYWYPVWFQQPTNCPPQDLWINKYVHNYATWDGSLNFRATLCGTGYGAYTVQHRVHFYSSSSKEFIGKIIYTGHNNAYLVCWMRGGGRSYGWGTTGGNGITVNVGDDGNSHNLGPGNTSETYITNNLTIPQGYEQAMTTSGQHQQSDGF